MLDLASRSNDGRKFRSFAVVPSDGWLKDELVAAGVPVTIIPTRGSVDVSYLLRLYQEMVRTHASIVHAHFPGASLYSGLAALLRGIPTVATFHGAVDLESIGRLRSLKLLLLRRLTHPVAVSQELRDTLAGLLGGEGVRVRHIGNGVAIPDDVPARSGPSAQGPRQKLRLGSLGNVRPAKAYETGLRAMAALRNRYAIDIEYEIAGQPDSDRSLWNAHHRLAEDLGLTGHVRFLGFVSDTHGFLRSLDAFILCSRSEGHPLALTQAMATGLPIVATKCGIESLLTDELDALLVDVGDHDAIAEAVARIAASESRGRDLGRNARVLAVQRFSIDGTLNAYQSLYQSVVAGRHRE